jgi:hypothetical protein
MIRYFLFVLVVILLTVPSWAQIYDGKQEEMVGTMDRAIYQVNDMWADVPIAGADEDVKPQDVRYQNMTVPLNEANERHFVEGAKATTIVDKAENDRGDNAARHPEQ